MKAIKKYTENGNSYEFYINSGVVRWVANDSVPFEDMLRKISSVFAEVTEAVIRKSNAARKADTAEFLTNYNPSAPSEEELFEMRAAFGESATVVNVFTGRAVRI